MALCPIWVILTIFQASPYYIVMVVCDQWLLVSLQLAEAQMMASNKASLIKDCALFF